MILICKLQLQQIIKKLWDIMDNIYLNVLEKSIIMQGISRNEIDSMQNCLRGIITEYKKNNIILYEGDYCNYLAIILSGNINITKTDFSGNKNIILKLTPSNIFAESVCLSGEKLPFNVEAETDCTIYKLEKNKIISPCSNSCLSHVKLIQNIISVLSYKNIMLTKKMNLLTLRSTSEKILTFLKAESIVQKSNKIKISLSRQQLADYLSVDRSALSRELSRLQDSGYIKYTKNEFKILK